MTASREQIRRAYADMPIRRVERRRDELAALLELARPFITDADLADRIDAALREGK